MDNLKEIKLLRELIIHDLELYYRPLHRGAGPFDIITRIHVHADVNSDENPIVEKYAVSAVVWTTPQHSKWMLLILGDEFNSVSEALHDLWKKVCRSQGRLAGTFFPNPKPKPEGWSCAMVEREKVAKEYDDEAGTLYVNQVVDRAWIVEMRSNWNSVANWYRKKKEKQGGDDVSFKTVIINENQDGDDASSRALTVKERQSMSSSRQSMSASRQSMSSSHQN